MNKKFDHEEPILIFINNIIFGLKLGNSRVYCRFKVKLTTDKELYPTRTTFSIAQMKTKHINLSGSLTKFKFLVIGEEKTFIKADSNMLRANCIFQVSFLNYYFITFLSLTREYLFAATNFSK